MTLGMCCKWYTVSPSDVLMRCRYSDSSQQSAADATLEVYQRLGVKRQMIYLKKKTWKMIFYVDELQVKRKKNVVLKNGLNFRLFTPIQTNWPLAKPQTGTGLDLNRQP